MALARGTSFTWLACATAWFGLVGCKVGDVTFNTNVDVDVNDPKEDGGKPNPRERDAGTANPDEHDAGAAPRPGEEGQPCIDRGSYAIDGRTYRGLAATCDGDLVCNEGVCGALPACTEGVEAECVFDPGAGLYETHGDVSAWALDGNYVYWVERGAFDDQDNYLGNGCLMRAEVGRWWPQILTCEMDLFDEHAGRLGASGLALAGGYGWILQDYENGQNWTYRMHLSGAGLPVPGVGRPQCIHDGFRYTVANIGPVLKAPVDGSAEPQAVTSYVDYFSQCMVVLDGFAYLQHAQVETADKHILRVKLDSEEPSTTLGSAGWLQGTYAGQLVARRETALDGSGPSWLAVAVPGTGTDLAWTNVVGGARRTVSFTLEGDYGYFYRYDFGGRRALEVIARGRLDGSSETQEIVAELWDWADQDVLEHPRFDVSERGVGWWPPEVGTLHYRPLP